MPWSDTFCTIMSTFTSMSASAPEQRAAMPGWSGTPVTVTLASESSATTAEMIACSMVGSSSVTQVPGSQVKLERTCSVTWWVRANSTARIAGFGQPTRGHLEQLVEADGGDARGRSGTRRGSAVNTPDTSV